MSQFDLEKLFEKRDSYLNILKHLSFELMMEPTDEEIKQIKELEPDFNRGVNFNIYTRENRMYKLANNNNQMEIVH